VHVQACINPSDLESDELLAGSRRVDGIHQSKAEKTPPSPRRRVHETHSEAPTRTPGDIMKAHDTKSVTSYSTSAGLRSICQPDFEYLRGIMIFPWWDPLDDRLVVAGALLSLRKSSKMSAAFGFVSQFLPRVIDALHDT
jgi:hypothetical protein